MQQLKPAVDTLSVANIVAIMGGWLPSIAALVSIIWGLIRIYETKTVQRWVRGLPKAKCICTECGKKTINE